ncbi:hypothetical protein [Saccharopolyspora sp. NPDC050642]|uniref:hypothetical protein n=1 Tax=Saccharopolyspora sp. NPDC050642 TaxID=3157099 RepID=UPI0033C31E1A
MREDAAEVLSLGCTLESGVADRLRMSWACLSSTPHPSDLGAAAFSSWWAH